MKKTFFAILAVIIFIVSPFNAVALEEYEGANVKSAILVDIDTGRVLYSLNEDEQRAPASITKVMTALLIVEAIDRGELSLNDVVTTSEYANSQGGSQIWLGVGEQMSVHDLLKSICVVSANDAAVAMAEYIAGSEEEFAVLMNERAKELGMNNTNFASASGLDRENHYTTASDITLMSREIMQYDIIREFALIWMDTVREGKSQLVNTNKLIKSYEGITGLKTGTTDNAGSCLVATATRNELNLMAVVLGAENNELRFDEAEKLLDYGFDNYMISELPPLSAPLKPIKVTGGIASDVKIIADPPKALMIPKNASAIKQELTLEEELVAPVLEGSVVGKVDVYIGDEIITSYNVLAAQQVDEMTMSYALMRVVESLVRMY